jgi:hypothetical protein
MDKMKIGFLIYTHNRIDDARINMEVIKNVWAKSNLFSDIKIVHAYNGLKKWYSRKYLEDDLLRIKNPGHFQGAAELIDVGIKKYFNKYNEIDYLIVLSSDTWNIKPKYVFRILDKMMKNNLYLATCSWGLPERNIIADVGMAVDFFIIDLKWAKKYRMFPINYAKFYNKYSELILYQKGGNIMLEKLLIARFIEASRRQDKKDVSPRYWALSKVYVMKDREPVHSHIDKNGFWIRKMHWLKMGLLTHHDPRPKKKILKELKITNGKYIKKLISSKKLDYYNSGVKIYKSYQ